MDGEVTVKVMQAWLMSRAGGFVDDSGADWQATTGHLGVLSGHHAAFAGTKNGKAKSATRFWCLAACRVTIRADRNQPRLAELALADAENPRIEIDIGEGEGKCVTDAKLSAIWQAQKRSTGFGIDAAAWMVVDRDGIGQAAQFFVHVNVWNKGLQRPLRLVDMAAGHGNCAPSRAYPDACGTCPGHEA
jgi:hypothetical protein